jgi:hypothetical protein
MKRKIKKMTHELTSKPASPMNPLGLEWPAFPKLSTAAAGISMTSWLEYMVDAFQRSVLFLDLLRQRGNEEIEITSRAMATVLRFDHDVLMSGRSLPRPMNYALSRIVPPPGVAIDPRKRPVVVVDPRAGQGPGIGGFKLESGIGDVLNAGHPVYFIGFGAEGRVKFFERVVELHPDALRPFAIGNCQAGYQTLMVAITCSKSSGKQNRGPLAGVAASVESRFDRVIVSRPEQPAACSDWECWPRRPRPRWERQDRVSTYHNL